MGKTNLQKATINWTVKAMLKKIEKGEITFDNAVQRELVWATERKSYLIDSILSGYEIPAFYARKVETGIYDILDGKQRANAIYEFVNGEYELTGMSEELEEYEGMTFEQLDEEDKDTILDFSIVVKYFDNITDKQVNELFFRLNNGKPLTNFERVKAKCKSLRTAQEIVQECDIFDEEKTGKKMSNDRKLELVYKAWAMLYMENPSLESKKINPVIMSVEITDEQREEMITILKKIFDVYAYISEHSSSESEKQDKKVKNRIITPTHFLSIIPFVKRSINEKRSVEQLVAWLRTFYNGTRRASWDDTYNDNASRGSAKPESIKKRFDCLSRSYDVKFAE